VIPLLVFVLILFVVVLVIILLIAKKKKEKEEEKEETEGEGLLDPTQEDKKEQKEAPPQEKGAGVISQEVLEPEIVTDDLPPDLVATPESMAEAPEDQISGAALEGAPGEKKPQIKRAKRPRRRGPRPRVVERDESALPPSEEEKPLGLKPIGLERWGEDDQMRSLPPAVENPDED